MTIDRAPSGIETPTDIQWCDGCWRYVAGRWVGALYGTSTKQFKCDAHGHLTEQKGEDNL